MKTNLIQKTAAAVACMGLLLPQGALAANPKAVAAGADISLLAGGVLVGQVVDAHGKPLAKSPVSIVFGDAEIVRTATDAQGRFAAKGLRGGVHQVVTQGQQATYRLWAPQTAPPVASQAALVITGDQVVNGQCCTTCVPDSGGGAGIGSFCRNHPVLIAGGIAAAIAIPVALANDDDDAS